MQRLAAESAQRIGEARRGTGRNDQPAAIGLIADQRVTHMRHVHTDLVRAAGFQPHGDISVMCIARQHPVVRQRRATALLHRHLRALGAVSADGLVHHTATGHRAHAYGAILAGDPPRFQITHQMRVSGDRLGDQQQAAGVLVEAMQDPAARQFGKCRQIGQQAVLQRAGRIARPGVYDEAGRLVDHQHIAVFVHDAERHGFRLSAVRRFRGCDFEHHPLAGQHPGTRFRQGIIEPHVAIENPLLDAAARVIGQQAGQHLIEPVTILTGGYLQSMLRKLHGALGYTLGPPGDSTETEIQPMSLFSSSRPSIQRIVMTIALATLLASSLSGCFLRKDKEDKSGVEQLYERAHKSMDSGNFKNAIQYYEGLEARFPFSNQSKQAQLDLIYCYYSDRQIEATVDAATTFERENPTHPRVDYALYMRGLAYFSGESSWYHRWFNADLAERPPKNLQESFAAFAQLIQRFPDSAYSADARQRMVFLRNRLADYELNVARYYMSRGAWLAAANRARFTVEHYDGAPAVAESLKIMLDAYRQLGMRDQADDVRLVLADNYPATLQKVVKEEQKPWYKFW